MTAPTHIAFAVASALIGGVESKTVIGLIAGGALLPDIDHPQSAIGRVFFFLSYPLNRLFGHRAFIHSLVLWLPITLLGFFLWSPFGWIGLGAISHAVIDCWNLSGVSLLQPITEKTFVLASKKYRLATGSRSEFILMIVFGFIAWGSGYIGSQGGIRSMLQAFLGDYVMAKESYERQGLKVCYMEGKIRLPNGMIEEGTWLIIGTDKEKDFMSIYDKQSQKIIHIPDQAKFLKAKLKTTDKQWQAVKLNEPAELKEGTAYFKPLKKWYIAKPGDVISGYVIHQDSITLSPFSL